MPPPPPCALEPCLSHQLILPTDKRNPCFSLYASEDGLAIRVFYGLELLEVVPDDAQHPAFKLLVGRLYNGGLKVTTLERVFGVTRKTFREWGLAIVSRDVDQLARVLLGGGNRKRSPAIDKYVRRRWGELRAAGCRNYRATLAGEVAYLFEVSLSGETLRQIAGAAAGKGAALPEPPETGTPTGPNPPPPPPGLGEGTCSPRLITTLDDLAPEPPESSPRADSSVPPPAAASPEASKCLPPIPPPTWQPQPGGTILCDHVGMLVFASALSGIAGATSPPEPLLAQWLGSILLGAVNIEQTKYLNWGDLGSLLGQTVRFPTPQREQLTRLATPATIDAVLRWNYQQLAPGPATTADDFYYDPHTAHYTGMQAVLKGWCAAIRWADKLINSDFIHTAQGHPVYFECTDNFEDLRARFLPLVGRFRACLQWREERVPTFVVDRGIYGNLVFEKVLADPAVHLITWEKGYQAATEIPWETLVAEHQAAGTYGSHTQRRQRNNARDHRLYHFEYIDRPWAKNPAMRQIVVRATNPAGNTVQLAILTDDPHRPAREIVLLMFNRWIQENDFKYLDKHFGINQLTSYRSTPYDQLRDQLADRQVPSRAFVRKEKEGRALAQRQARLLLASDRASRDQAQRQLLLDGLLATLAQRAIHPPADPAAAAPTAAEAKALARLRNATKRHAKYARQRTLKSDQLHQQILLNETEQTALQREVSRLDQLIEQDMVRMDLRNKTLMDAIKITARNLFYRLFAPFKTAYDNYRDDHDHYRELTQCDGVLRWTGTEVEAHLVPRVNHPPKLRKIIDAHLADLNAGGLVLPDGSGRPLRLLLTRPDQISVRINDPAPL